MTEETEEDTVETAEIFQFSDFHPSSKSWTREQMLDSAPDHAEKKSILIMLDTDNGEWNPDWKISQMSNQEAITLMEVVKTYLIKGIFQ